jgi:hypothetical protein
VEEPAKLLKLGRKTIAVAPASVGLEYPVGEAEALALPLLDFRFSILSTVE